MKIQPVIVAAALAWGCAAAQDTFLLSDKTPYYIELSQLVTRKIKYPPNALFLGQRGTCRVKATFNRDGTITDASLLSSTGFKDLDKECISAFARVGKFPPVPDDVPSSAESFISEFPMTFSLSTK